MITTHSLFVLSDVPSECVRLLRDFEVFDAPTPTEGREPNALATEIFDVALRPRSIDRALTCIAALIDGEDFAQARTRLETLSQTLGEYDTRIVHLQTALALEDI